MAKSILVAFPTIASPIVTAVCKLFLEAPDGVVLGKSRHIHRDAQKTLAELNNRNLLLSRRAVINTKPELEIYADDVKCAHGATVAEIDDTALYYLLTRGISRSQALIMLNFGFIRELINQIPNEDIAGWLLSQLHDRFVGMEVK